ncbi:unnamed protein product [Rhizoctonia solani]|uniref:RNA-dependent RNA polymerase n=1 Tax=Rhizoctonia solani TaxID=456999 RepID=A0A8H3B9P3_9AGAM|nr:unnamed protein product [Rhizoctonia solani]
MYTLYFSNLPVNVATIAFRDAIEKFVVDLLGEGANPPKPLINLAIPDNSESGAKHVGNGSIEFQDEKAVDLFMAKIKTEPIMFGAEALVFSREQPPNAQATSSGQSANSPPQAPRSRPESTRSPNGATRGGFQAPGRSRGAVMNLNRVKHPQPEKKEKAAPNIHYQRKLRYRLSVLGQHLRLETLEFGVLRNWNFSVEYSKSLIEDGGYFIFEDNEKSLRITTGGSHSNNEQPSIAIAKETINYVALGTDAGKSYMFLALCQNPHFELADIARPLKKDGRFDARRSRDRLSALDECHERVAPYASRWIKLTFHPDSRPPAPNAEMCAMAKLPPPDIDPPLTFNKLDLYSPRNVALVQNWFQGSSLHWDVAFQVEALFRNGVLVPTELIAIKPAVEALASESNERAADVLKSFRDDLQAAGSRNTFNDFEDKNVVDVFNARIHKSAQSIPWERIGMSKSSFMCYQVKITPTAVHLNGPLEEQSNRVIRRYPGYETHFIRVSFTDEADGRTRFEYQVDTQAFTQKRLGNFLKNAIQICDRKFELLGYSQSGFREHACLFVAPFEWNGETINGEHIRQSLGNFDKVIEQPARYGARMSQAFSATSQSVIVKESEIKHLLDIKGREDSDTFTDGCGTISRELAKDVWDRMLKHLPAHRQGFHHENEQPPAAFQIRIGGSKGMVRLDPKLEGRVLGIRPSMTKFEADHDLSLEIARAFVNYSPCFLNRPLVVLLWSGGVEDEVFLKLMQRDLDEINSGMKTLEGVARQLIANRLGNPFHLANTFKRLSRLGLELDQPNLRTSGLHKLLTATLFHVKRDLKYKARIRVPDSYTLVGVCDEDNYLRPRQIYACVQNFDQRSGVAEVRYLKGRYLITRSPVIHPGDAQVVWAIGEPPEDSPFYGEGNNLPNMVVFSTRGLRPVPNMLGGGDLDGDLYNLIKLPELIPRYRYCPAKYPTPKPKSLERPSTIDDVADFMVEFICNDALGMISINHLVIASTSDLQARDEDCIHNAKLHSKAVDFIKTGRYVRNCDIRKAKYDKDEETGVWLKPDWLASHGLDPTDGRFYECKSVLGKLFRTVDLPEGNPARESDVKEQMPLAIRNCVASHVARYRDEIQATVSSPDTVTFVRSLLSRYTAELNHISVAHTISSESSERVSEIEVMLGTNLEANSQPNLIERMKGLTRNLANSMRDQLKAKEDESNYIWLGRAWRAYLLTCSLGDKAFGAFSFSWLALDSVLDALHAIDETFLPHTGPILPAFAFIPSSELKPDEDIIPPDYDNWNDWVDDIKEEAPVEGETTATEGDGQQNTDVPATESGQGQTTSANATQNSNGGGNGHNRNGRGKGSSRGSPNSNGQTSGSIGGRKPGYRIILNGDISF